MARHRAEPPARTTAASVPRSGATTRQRAEPPATITTVPVSPSAEAGAVVPDGAAAPSATARAGLFGAVSLLGASVALIVLLPLLITLPPLQATLCALQAAISAAGIARSAHPGLRPIALVTFVFTFSWLGVAPTYQLATGRAAWRDDAVLVGPYTTTALLLLVLATATLYVGFFRPGAAIRAATGPAPAAPLDPPRWICVGYLLTCLALAPGAISAGGGLAGMFSTRAERTATLLAQGLSLQEVGGLKIALVSTLPGALATAGCYLVLIRVLNQRRGSGWGEVHAVDITLLVLGLTLVVVLANPFVNTRALSAAALGCLILLVLRPRSGWAGVRMAAVLLVATLVVYPAANAFRGTTQTETQGLEFLAGADFDGFQQAINTVEFVDARGHSGGTYTISGALYFVPRSVWAEKERPASIDVATYRGYAFTNLSLPFHAEMYLDFGPVGMTLVLFVLASAGRRSDLDWAAGLSSRAALMAPYACLACLSIIRGPIGSNGPVYLTNLALIGLGLFLAPAARPQPREAADVPS
ncbi:hypothetical protein SAMN05660657_00205 [Geodermatophilus amargosae]|uniref:Oligosaccharide repeat unit polymerase n=1 Tax=Geodermatophilus amargosae TaxID=1296565 RepID=A0A1I6X7T0_9ACTN|nr:hypothetical protein [Geodermatophilus amargosae]SFT34001.1 hypothetical protein SAMN05660657_00205 [Geodermatophilus amargosae]